MAINFQKQPYRPRNLVSIYKIRNCGEPIRPLLQAPWRTVLLELSAKPSVGKIDRQEVGLHMLHSISPQYVLPWQSNHHAQLYFVSDLVEMLRQSQRLTTEDNRGQWFIKPYLLRVNWSLDAVVISNPENAFVVSLVVVRVKYSLHYLK